MSKRAKDKPDDEPRPEYDSSKLRGDVRGEQAERYREGTNLVLLEPDVARAFPDDESVNEALRLLMEIAQRAGRSETTPEQPKRFKLNIQKLTAEDIRRKLDEYEAQYGMSSREFIAKYNSCQLPENLDFLDWAGYYDMAADVGIVSLKLEA
jgi:hypothetical protein